MTHAEGYGLVLGKTQEAQVEVDIAALVHRHASLLFRVAHSVLRNPQEAEDTVQDVFLRVLQHRGKLPLLRDERVWLVRIAWNLALDRRRRSRPEQMDDAFAATLAANLVPADQAVGQARELRAALAAIEALPKKERAVLLLAALDEMSHVEIAAVLGKSESAVRALLFRARSRLKQRLQSGAAMPTLQKGGLL